VADEKLDQETLSEAAEALQDVAEQVELAQAMATEDGAAAQGADEPARGDDASGATLEGQIELLQTELEQAKDSAMRAAADAQNVKRRAEQDVEKARKFALERFCSELLPVVDNLERSLEAVNGDDAALTSIAEGVQLTLKSFVDALGKFQIEQLDPLGEPFDPQHHQAMSMIENPDAEPNTVLAVMQKGYTLNGRLVRPAMVMVSKEPAAS
jgi:molecular chaperone GrpE